MMRCKTIDIQIAMPSCVSLKILLTSDVTLSGLSAIGPLHSSILAMVVPLYLGLTISNLKFCTQFMNLLYNSAFYACRLVMPHLFSRYVMCPSQKKMYLMHLSLSLWLACGNASLPHNDCLSRCGPFLFIQDSLCIDWMLP